MATVDYIPAQRIRIIESSLKSFTISWFSLVPLVGLLFALWSLDSYSVARKESVGGWNPARSYLMAAFYISCTGIVLWLGSVAVLAALFLKYYSANF